jgi:molecular chaperone DnaK (HSP70)
MDIGIDLGTTFSVIAVKGNIQLTPNYRDSSRYLPECDVTIIPTPEGNPTYPSVLWWDPSEPDKFVVGVDAKQKAADGYRPIMFSKRAIGTKEKLRMNDRLFTAKEVAIQFLKYMKACAEQALGEPVDRAVVTHPAYFDRNQVQETLEAAQAAGFEMDPAQMMMEPAAAALAYTQNDERDPLRVLTYDLGGGTFDVTVLEKRQGVITMKSFDGNPRLGGYNFDRALVQWVLAGLKAQGRNIPYDENNEEDRGRHARLLQVAEGIKEQLSQQRTAKAPVNVKIDFLVDDQGRRAQFLGKITREQFTGLIKESLDETIDCCRRALAGAGVGVGELDAILLVGGSTYGQWVQEAVEGAFKVQVEPYNPDLCVAAGAAIEAAKLPKKTAGAGVDLRLDAKPICALPSTNIPGVLKPLPGSRYNQAACRNLLVMLATPGGALLGPATVGEDGTFILEDIALPEDGEAGEFTVTVCDGPSELLRTPFTMAYQPEGGLETPINTVLPKPIYLKTADGLAPVAEEGAELPAKCEIRLRKIFGDSVVTVPVMQDGEEIGLIRVDNIPETAGEGSLVLISVELTQKNEMRGMAKVMTRTGTVVAQREVRINFPPIEIPELPNLRAQFEDLNDKREQTILLTEDPAERLTLAGPGEKLVKKLRKLFEEQEPDRQEINHELKKLEKMVNPPPDDMEPPRTQVVSMIEECREMLASKADDPNMQSFQPILKRIEKEANDAHATKNRKKWGAASESLRQAHARIEKMTGGGDGGGGGGSLPPTPLLKDRFGQDVDGLRSSLRMAQEKAAKRADYGTKDKPRCEALERDLDTMGKGIDKVNDELPPEQGLAQLRLVMLRSDAIKKKIRLIDEAVDVEKIWMRSGREVSITRTDKVHFAVAAPPAARPGMSFIVDVWAHLERQRIEVERRIRQAAAQTDPSPVIRPKGPFAVARGTTLYVRLQLSDLVIERPEDVILWDGEIGNASFVVAVPQEASEGPRSGWVTVHWEGCFQIARVPLQIQVVPKLDSAAPIAHTLERLHKAFASYASADRDEVLHRIQGMQKMVPDLEVFLDVARLRSGTDWEAELWRVIPAQDVFYLFWSRNARQSPWVEKEWRCALKTRGLEFIDPVPLESPDVVAPPEELKKMHFNDWILAYQRSKDRQES